MVLARVLFGFDEAQMAAGIDPPSLAIAVIDGKQNSKNIKRKTPNVLKISFKILKSLLNLHKTTPYWHYPCK